MSKSNIFIFLCLAIPLSLLADSHPAGENLFDVLLKRHVRSGQVDYAGLKKDVKSLDEVLLTFEKADEKNMSRDERMAFWINAYNAFTLKLILQHYPLKSIRDIPSAKRWDAKIWNVSGRILSLDDIEQQILRPMGDPRIHFCIVCASLSCPDLAPEAYRGEKLETQLARQTELFLSQDKGLQTKVEKGFFYGENAVLQISKLFSWYKDDFIKDNQGVLDYVVQHSEKAKAFKSRYGKDLKIQELDYDWTLNGR